LSPPPSFLRRCHPDHFFFGDPHINFYEGTAEFDDLDFYLPDER
jgi:hypothetical protein